MKSSHLPLVPAPFRSAHASNMGPGLANAPRETGEREARRRFLAARSELELSQLASAESLRVSDSTLADWERGARKLPAWALLVLEARANAKREAA